MKEPSVITGKLYAVLILKGSQGYLLGLIVERMAHLNFKRIHYLMITLRWL